MTDHGTKKRKRQGDVAGKPSKKLAAEGTQARAKVSSVVQSETCPPVVAITSGPSLPTDIRFSPYVKQIEPKRKTKSKTQSSELLLHSTAHRSLDYTAREESGNHSRSLLNHYVGVYDPQTGKLQVVEARKMMVRGEVRAKQLPDAAADETAKKTMLDRRTDLGQAFGTKKAKKALNDKIINAIGPAFKKGEKTTIKIDEAGKAMLSSVGAITSTMASRSDLQAVVDAAKPVPVANLDAEDIQDVYDPKQIIGTEILNQVPVLEWQEKVKHGDSVQVASRFVAARINQIASNQHGLERLRVLRYMLFVLMFYLSTKPGRKGVRLAAQPDVLREKLAPAPEAVIQNIRRKFSEGGELRKFHIDLLMTHMCVFACIVDNFEVDTQSLMEDLRLDQRTMNSYFHEIGGRVKVVADKVGKTKRSIARLALPLDFPKQRFINPTRR